MIDRNTGIGGEIVKNYLVIPCSQVSNKVEILAIDEDDAVAKFYYKYYFDEKGYIVEEVKDVR